jgi:Htaa
MATNGKGASLEWGVKQSFRGYVEGAGGSIQVAAGSERTADGGFAFAAVPGAGLKRGANGALQGVGRFTGEVLFQAHGGMLQVFLADPAVEIGPDGAVITVAPEPERDRRLTLAILDLAAATPGADGAIVIPSKLSQDGWQLLGDHYAPMTPLDPVRLKLG